MTPVLAPSDVFVTCVHDVCPANRASTQFILRKLGPLIGSRASLAVIPRFLDEPWPDDRATRCWGEDLRAASSEILLHGLIHRRTRSISPFSAIVGRNDEFAALPAHEARQRIDDGRA